jgi:hypothetical protein
MSGFLVCGDCGMDDFGLWVFSFYQIDYKLSWRWGYSDSWRYGDVYGSKKIRVSWRVIFF